MQIKNVKEHKTTTTTTTTTTTNNKQQQTTTNNNNNNNKQQQQQQTTTNNNKQQQTTTNNKQQQTTTNNTNTQHTGFLYQKCFHLRVHVFEHVARRRGGRVRNGMCERKQRAAKHIQLLHLRCMAIKIGYVKMIYAPKKKVFIDL